LIFGRISRDRSKKQLLERRRQAAKRIDEAMLQARKEQDRAFAEEIERWKDRVGA